jgi:hypothetical protein
MGGWRKGEGGGLSPARAGREETGGRPIVRGGGEGVLGMVCVCGDAYSGLTICLWKANILRSKQSVDSKMKRSPKWALA